MCSSDLGFEGGVLREGFLAGGVLRTYPGQGFFAVDVFQPEVGVLGCGHDDARVEEGKEGERKDVFHW